MAYWFRQKFNLPPHDPRFLAMTLEDIEVEYWADHYFNNPATESVSDDSYDSEAIDELMGSDDWEDVINV